MKQLEPAKNNINDSSNKDCNFIEIHNDQHVQFPCTKHDKLTNVNECINCDNSLTCDIYSTMLDEDADID
jgi:hypothetical protein